MAFDKIRTLNDREKAREKLPIFYGSRDNFMHGFREVGINNTIDEITNNFDNGVISILLHEDLETITVSDTGRGMPIGEVSDDVPNWELFFTILFASGKYDTEDAENSGVNGVGGVCLQFSSVRYDVRSWYDGKEYIIEFENGGDIKTPLTYIGKTNKHGTEITFKLDKECYTKTKYNPLDLKDIINKASSSSPKTIIDFTYNGETSSYHYDTLEDYYNQNIQENNYFKCNQKIYNDENEITKIELLFSTSIEPIQEAYLNRNYLSEGGIINKGVLEGIKTFVHKYAKENALYSKNEKIISIDDVTNSVNFVVSVLSSNVEFQSQTKFSSQKELYGKIAKKYIQEYLEILQIERKDEFIKMVEQILLTKRANEKAESSRKDLRKKLEEGISNNKVRPDKFVPCRSKYANEVELIVIEGDSALNSIKSSRDAKTMCIYPLKGKIINSIKNKLDKVLDNSEVKDLFKILGCGMIYKGKQIKGVPNFNIDSLNVKNVLICRDMDTDGQHIETLLLTLFYTFAPELIKQRRIYILYTPLYIINHKKDEIFAYSEEERNEIVKSFNGDKFTETRYKGIGGLKPQILNKTAMDIKKRKMKCVTWEEVEKGIEMVEICMSDKTLPQRKELIELEGHKYFDFSLIED
jgi:DNA gyrase subunit B